MWVVGLDAFEQLGAVRNMLIAARRGRHDQVVGVGLKAEDVR